MDAESTKPAAAYAEEKLFRILSISPNVLICQQDTFELSKDLSPMASLNVSMLGEKKITLKPL